MKNTIRKDTPQHGVSVRVLRAGEEQLADVCRLMEEYYADIDVLVRDSREDILRYLKDGRSGIWLAYVDSEPVGCILYRPLSGEKQSGELKRLYVCPRRRGGRIAFRLLEAAEGFARGIGIRALYLDSMEKLAAALAFYERNGYRRCERYNDNPQAELFMRKRL